MQLSSPLADKNGSQHPSVEALFVSDVHLHESLPATTAAFERFLQDVAPQARQLFLLGDIFEYWAGDDDIDTAYNRRIVDGIRAVSDAGVAVSWISGNRDFLVGHGFADRAGFTLLPDPYVATIADRLFVLTHGDLLCTDDVDYQRFRSMVRQKAWQDQFLGKSLAERKSIIAGMRAQSMASQATKQEAIMDVNNEAVTALFESSHAPVMIHGHTHRPDRHEHQLSGSKVRRYVLPDWDCDDTSPRGGWIAITGDGSVNRLDTQGRPSPFNHF